MKFPKLAVFPIALAIHWTVLFVVPGFSAQEHDSPVLPAGLVQSII